MVKMLPFAEWILKSLGVPLRKSDLAAISSCLLLLQMASTTRTKVRARTSSSPTPTGKGVANQTHASRAHNLLEAYLIKPYRCCLEPVRSICGRGLKEHPRSPVNIDFHNISSLTWKYPMYNSTGQLPFLSPHGPAKAINFWGTIQDKSPSLLGLAPS